MINETPCKKIGILGGTFDPIHYGHLLIAQSAAEEFHLDQVMFLPTGKSPHKSTEQVTTPTLRCRMVEKAIFDHPLFFLSKMEAENTETNYTCLTLQKLVAEHPDSHFYFIMGEDSLDDFSNWKNPAEICRLATILVAVRNDTGRSIEDKVSIMRDLYHADIQMLHAPNFSVSSSEIRERIRTGKSIRYMLPEQIELFIRENSLYQE